jgi:hypothetical protein
MENLFRAHAAYIFLVDRIAHFQQLQQRNNNNQQRRQFM